MRVKKPQPYKKIEGLEHIDKVIDIDQSPIGRTPRSNPATYTDVFSEIRTLFTQTPEAHDPWLQSRDDSVLTLPADDVKPVKAQELERLK